VFVAPFVDGVSTRRTTLMAALQHGVAVVGTDGRLTDDILRASREALTLAPVGDRHQLEDAVRRLADDPGLRRSRGAAGRELYTSSFAWPVTAAIVATALR
jgi:glycosyltransferase involved in cell wall biosynthesis